MFGIDNIYYNSTLRKYVIFFGSLFSDLWIQRDTKEKDIVQTFKVPLNYGPKEKFLARLEGNPDLDREIAIQLPRMTFEMTGFTYDPSRKLNVLGRQLATTPSGQTVYQYNPSPWNITFRLEIMVKNAEDGTRIIEQILPYFVPHFMATLNINSDLGQKVDVPLVLDNISETDTYEGSFEERRELIWTLDFTLKAWLFGPTRDATGIIKHIDVNISIPPTNISVYEANTTNTSNTSSIAIYPGMWPNGEPLAWEGAANSECHPTGYVDPYTVEKEDTWDFIVDFSGES